ncbi:ATP-binding cassette domain-containing protein [Dyadobacter sp. CY261]|uniref:ATP-binding cassette domain-containing protein n=1 Tax=Dyadobacter sp. CY261 TaxID=2907203 RepID=UPI001F41F17A|nr:ATP-binding cassette domain-containing protein [Dyadobacter sp. CY261]
MFKDFNFASNAQYIVFQGRSGCGKSTLLKLLSGNLWHELGTMDLNSLQTPCLILQEDSLFPWLNGYSNIALVTGKSKDEIKSHILFPELQGFLDKKAYEMSFGQRRIIELFRAMLFEPEILYLDEPFNYLDEHSRSLIARILFSKDLLPKTKTIILTTHYDSDIELLRHQKYEVYHFSGVMPYAKLEKKNI